MKRGTGRDSSGDAALRELERALDAFMATHVTTAANFLATKSGDECSHLFEDEVTIDQDPISSGMTHFQLDLRRVQCISSVMATRRGPARVVSMGRLLLSWLQTVESSSAAAAASTATALPPSAAETARAAEHAQQQSPIDPVASWLVATLLKISFLAPQMGTNADFNSTERAAVDELINIVVSRCLLSFQRSWQADEETHRRLRAESSGNLFSYLTMRKAKPKTPSAPGAPSAVAICLTCITEAGLIWGHVLGLAACLAPDVARIKLQNEIFTRSTLWNATKPWGDITQHPFLKYLTHIRLGLAPTKTNPSLTLTSRMSDAARWLRLVMPLLLKPHRSHVRSACAHLISQMLLRELFSLNRLELSVVYTSTGSDWSRCISDLHAAALRLTDSAKKKSRGRSQQHFEASAWALRTVVLALAPGEIFTRYWREDALALLRLQYHLNQDASANGATSYNVLPSLELSFTYMMHRHFLLRDSGAITAGAPSDADCMEIINTTQAWGFFSLPRLKPQHSSGTGSSSFTALKTIALPALVHVSRAMAAYNMTYTVQSHLRRLLAESVGVGDPQKLVGLEALADLLSLSQSDDSTVTFQVNHNDLVASKQMIGELVGRVLLECSTRIGHKLLTEIPVAVANKEKLQLVDDEDGDDEEHWKNPTNAVAVATFASALSLMPALYAYISLSNEQKLLLLVRTSVNAERVVRRRAHEALLALIGPQKPHSTEPLPPGAGVVIRALTDCIMRMHVSSTTAVSDAGGAIIILRLLSLLLEPSRAAVTRWESPRARYEALIQVEAISVYLLARGDDNIEAEQLLRLAALETLQVAHDARLRCSESALRDSIQFPLVDRPSVWTLLNELDPELQTAFFTFKQVKASTDKLSALRRLIFDTSERHSFRWSLGLARIFRTLTRRAPDVTAYIWADVADKVAKLEPVLCVTFMPDSPQNQRELARWRNLALLSTVSACQMLQTQTRKTEASSFSENSSEPPSVAPSTMVATLVRQLACYLRSANVGQRNAAVFVLGHSGSVALSTMLDVLGRLEAEAFTAPSTGEQEASDNNLPQNTIRGRSVRTMKLPKKKMLELQHARVTQLTLQWAIGRCYRLLLEPRTREQNESEEFESGSPMNERLRRAASAFLAKMMATFEDSTASNPVLLMVQLDFVASLRSLLLHSNAASQPVLQLPHDKLAALLLTWCGSFDRDLADRSLIGILQCGFVSPTARGDLYSHWTQQCDVFSARDGSVLYPWIWVDNQHQLLGSTSDACAASRLVAQYVLCHRAFSTLADLLRSSLQSPNGNGTWDGESVVTWLDASFSVDSAAFQHFNDLHHFAQRALHALLELRPGSARFNHIVKRSLDKASSAAHAELPVARQYLQALGASSDVMSYFRSLLHRLQERHDTQDKDELYLAVRLLHVLLLHVGIQHDDKVMQHRQVALDMVAALVCEPELNSEDDESAATRWGLQGYYSPSLDGLVAGRLQVSVSALLASRFSVLSLRVSLAILRSMPTKPLQNREEIAQQRQMLAAVLPWLAEVSLKEPKASATRPEELLELLFNLTAVLADSCGEQLDHIWLTLAFASTGEDANLREIVSFLFRQRTNQLPSETAKTVMWWLCRWQDAASDVLRLLLLQPLKRREADTEAATALDELGALVTLASDTSCHLQTSFSDVRTLAVHLVHLSLTTLFAVLENDTIDEKVSRSIRQHCHVLLHSTLPLLEAPRGLLAAALRLIQTSTLIVNAEAKNTQLEAFLEALRALAACLSTSESQIWSDLCVQEIALSISPDTSSPFESLDTIPKSSPHEVCVRFALVAYTQLSPRFQGDILLSVLTLLRQTLTVGIDERKSRSVSLARECLALLAMLLRTMPVSRLALYPQVFWVSLALLTHCRQQRDNSSGSSSSLHDGALELLSIIWSRTPFTSHSMVLDVIQCTRPGQRARNSAHNSVLMEVVRCVYADDSVASRARAMDMMRKAVLLVPRSLLGVSSREHLVTCTLALLPALMAPSNEEQEVREDLVVLWQSAASSSDDIVEFLQTRDGIQASDFIKVFVPALYALELTGSSFDGLKLSLDVLVACLPLPQRSEAIRTDSTATDLNDERCDFVFVLLEELLQDVLRRKERVWRPAPELEATLARLLRSPRSERQWRLSMRVLSWVAEIAKVAATTGSLVTPLPTNRRNSNASELSTALGRIAESEDDQLHVEAKTLKKPPLLRVASPRTQSSGSNSKKSINERLSNNEVPRSREPSSKEEDHSPSTEIEYTTDT
ncbi:uncharacterized protein PITG_10161 [Phytophthora infestans T30-4]|uniref:Uncharacterized protein n=1 Tax=Phytophthora infestans (strain T30-4) TaxID=403677 RepID=D0NEG9_PHYIT|nr:uncharacterized protein PITG_10161 [Phytophthora infestans T30-4]EEY56614.1 conserved hypothetical protein [Phytophthora infestans T30-4]|eukprot:XP_002902688.1 conserved hypothetical protein [Phytophthora infestans T30-4]